MAPQRLFDIHFWLLVHGPPLRSRIKAGRKIPGSALNYYSHLSYSPLALNITMQFNNLFFSAIFAAVSASSAYAALVPRQDSPTCGTTGDATLSDCRDLVNSQWSNLNYENTCTFGVSTAYNPICHPGNCCVYVTVDTLSQDDVQNAARTIVNGCASESTNTVNGVINVNSDARVCIGNGDACGDCFED
uniref:Uncharacterized protein n=2 Tax=Moniliophthora roreri TaxID=221103 RepID=A0A0W0FFG6_MONRR